MSKTKKIYYKVVRKNLQSAMIDDENAVIQYKINEWVQAPKGMKLFCFEDIDSAKRFMDYSRNYKLYKCYVRYPSIQYRYIINSDLVDKDFINGIAILTNKKKSSKKIKCINNHKLMVNPWLPYSTVFVREIKLLEEIKCTQ